jgi:phosphoglycerate kinase
LPNDNGEIKIPENTKIALLENLRFNPGEENNDKTFIQNIVNATNSDAYVQDGFAVIHRAHASTDAIKNFLPVYAGLLLEKEVTNLDKITKNPEKPVLLIIGGAKVEDKQPLIDKFTKTADQIVVGGKIAADGYKSDNPKIYVAEDYDEDSAGKKLDIGPLSTAKVAGFITDAKTIIWNGLLGYAEDPAYATSSTITAEVIGEHQDATTVICGGDTTGFVENIMENHPNLHYSLVSTGGGASLEYLLSNKLPGLEAITK